MNKKKILIIASICILILTIIGSTVSFFGWKAEDSLVSVTVSSGTGACNKISDNEVLLEPTTDKNKGRIIKLSAKQLMTSKAYITWDLVVNNIDELQHESFKYELVNSTTGVSYGSGNFSNINTETNSNTITFKNNEEKLLYDEEYEFILYLWIDGVNFNNPHIMGGKDFDFDISCNIYDPTISLNNNSADVEGTTALYFKDNTVYLDQSLTQIMTTAENPITLPSKVGYVFDGYYTKIDDVETKVINNDGYITEDLFLALDGESINIYAKWNGNTYSVNYYDNLNYANDKGTVIAVINGRTYYKANDGPALVGYTFNTGSSYTGPFLVSTNEDAVAYYYSDNSTLRVSDNSINSNGLTYYYSSGTGWTSGDYTDSSGLSNRTKYSGTRSEVAQMLIGAQTSTVSQTLTYGTSTALTANTYTKKGFTFAGWSTSPTGEIEYTDGESVKNLTEEKGGVVNLYAIWKATPYYMTIHHYYYPYGETSATRFDSTPTDFKYGLEIYPSDYVVNKTGYIAKKFNYYYSYDDGSFSYVGQKNISDSFLVTQKMIINIYYNLEEYTVKYDTNGGSTAPSSQTKTYGVDLTLSSTKPTRSGYTFLGWSTNKSATTPTYKAGDTFTTNSSTTLYAVWTQGPTYTKLEFKNVTSSGYDVYIYGVTDPQGINFLKFPTWTNNNGLDDITWGTVANQASGTYHYRVNTSEHSGATGSYATHIYVVDNSGNQEYVAGGTVIVPDSQYTNSYLTGKSGTLTFNSNSASYTSCASSIQLNWSEVYNPALNTSKISISSMYFKSSANCATTFYFGGAQGVTNMGIYVNGTLLENMNRFSGTHACYTPGTYQLVNPNAGTAYPWTTNAITHNSDGTLTVPIRVYLRASNSAGDWYSDYDSTQNITLTDTR